ncbi:hypothetical protein [Pseudobacteroides cellulosolvens]|uniref:Uncharacterized protein n=1 Tax=Pseudobacteroides cellulosolvens ATCC 35603 = DSM 2933 TaxID=398512 RepID=A0A0L6JMD5_9FIRM|nr:hypothetical protein [Pseudobacteroides cellulosolvens]KNY26934.1 hypothetical protein Bccel_2199 [Pseudobacteroides cellulosolvens ATCC 35603 = DSM 2933]
MKALKIIITIFLSIGTISAIKGFIEKILSANNDTSYNIGYSIGSLIVATVFIVIIVKLIQSIKNDF